MARFGGIRFRLSQDTLLIPLGYSGTEGGSGLILVVKEEKEHTEFVWAVFFGVVGGGGIVDVSNCEDWGCVSTEAGIVCAV